MKYLILLLLLGTSAFADQVNCVKWKDTAGTTVGTYCKPFTIQAGTNITFSDDQQTRILTIDVPSIATSTEKIRYAADFPGVDAGAKIVACIADIPSTGGTCDATALEGAQTISSLITISKPVTLKFGYATYTCSAAQCFQFSSRGIVFVGNGNADAFATDGSANRGTVFKVSTAGGKFIVIGSDNGHVYDAGDYDGFQGTRLENFQLTNTAGVTALNNGLGNYGNGSIAVQDWRGGGNIARNISITHFNYGFWGIQSDLNHFTNLQVDYNKIGLYFGPRSDQLTVDQLSTLANDTAVQLDSVKNARFFAAQFVADGSASDYAIIVGSKFTFGSRGNVFLDCWFEQTDPNARTAFAGMGAGDSVQTIDTRFIRPFIVANSTYLSNFMSIDNADYIDVDEPAFYRSTAPFSGAMFNFIGTSSSTNVRLERFTSDNSYVVFQNSGAGTPKVTIERKDPQAWVLDYQAAAAQTSTVEFWDRGTVNYVLQKTAGGTFQMFDNRAGFALFRGNFNNASGINSQSTGAVEINKDANSGTGGLQVWSGGAVPSQVFSVSSAGLGTFNGGIIGATIRSQTANVASAGTIRLAKTDALNFRNNANGADINGIGLDGSDVVQVGGNTNGVRIGSSGAPLKKILTTTSTIDFAAQAANTCTDSSGITLTGAVDGDSIDVGVPAADMVANVEYSAFVSAADTVKVRLCNNATGASSDPASGTFRVTVTQY